jgi:HAD superfamily hydrolase (TIGR01509 family)
MKIIDAILFDWDGTLVDTSKAAFAATQSSLNHFGILLESELYEQIYSPNWHNIYEALQLPHHQWDEADNLWLYYYGQEVPVMGEDDRILLDALAGKYCLGVVTNANRSRVRREISALGIAEYFGAVISGDDVQHRKPHPEGLETAMKIIGRKPHACCYVGDSPEDVEMGKRAGVLTIGIISNYPGNKRLLSAHPDFCIDCLSELALILKAE